MSDTTHLGLPLIAAAQAQKHVTHNEALARLDALVHLAVSERGRETPPTLPEEGDRTIVGAAPTGIFAGHADALAVFDAGAWRFLTPRAGWTAFVEDESRLVVFDGTDWREIEALLTALDAVESLGIGTAPDSANPLAAKLNGALFTARESGSGGSGDLRFTLNKESAGDTVSQLYQSGYSGRAEVGLVGSDDFSVKVSADGSAWTEALRIDRSTALLTGKGLRLSRASGDTLVVNADTNAAAIVLKRSGATVGSIAVTTTGTAYNTTSDARLKTGFRPVDGAGDVLDALVVGRFTWAHAPEAAAELGLRAQDVAVVAPQAVTAGDDDPAARPGDAGFRPWSVDYARLVPLLIAEVQALRRRIAALEA